MFTYLVFPALGGWPVQLQDEASAALLPDSGAAERRARRLAARASVKGRDSEALLLDCDATTVGRWWAEAYTPMAAPNQELAA